MLDVFGLNPADPIWDRASGGGDQLEPIVDALVERLINDRAEAKQARDYSRADEIRNQLSALGIELTDTRDGTTWSLSKQA